MSRWLTRNNAVSSALLLGAAVIAGLYVWAGSPRLDRAVFVLAFLAFSAVFVSVGYMYAADLIDYSREGWDYEKRQPRAKFRYGNGYGGTPMRPRTAMWFGYPIFIIAFGIAAGVTGLQAFGIVDIFGLSE